MSKLLVKIPDGSSVDAGTITADDGSLTIVPPETPIYEQLCERLRQYPFPRIGFHYWALGIGATALCLRWGTYLSVLMDETKPVDPRAADSRWSMISDQEMKRINIEASNNLSKLFQLMHKDEDRALDLMRRAYEYLPMPQRRAKRNWETYKIVLGTLVAVHSVNHPEFPEHSYIAATNPYRSLANTVISLAYRNGPIEDIHAGKGGEYSLAYRRLTHSQARAIIRFTSERLSGVIGARPFWDGGLLNLPPWPERVRALPFVMFYPHDWSLIESSSPVRLNRDWAE